MVRREVLRDGHLPAVPVRQELLLVVKQLLVGLGGELVVGALDDSVDGARLLLIKEGAAG